LKPPSKTARRSFLGHPKKVLVKLPQNNHQLVGEAVLMAVKQHPDAKRSYLADEEPTKLCLTKKRLTPSDPSVLFETEHPNV